MLHRLWSMGPLAKFVPVSRDERQALDELLLKGYATPRIPKTLSFIVWKASPNGRQRLLDPMSLTVEEVHGS